MNEAPESEGEGDEPAAEPAEASLESELETAQQVLGYTFQDSLILHRALTHASRARLEIGEGPGSYQRLEFLGDAVLAAILAEGLYGLLPKADEGELTRRLVDLARGRTQIHLARELGLARLVRLGDDLSDGARESERILEDVFESLIGAIFVDGGYDAARERVLAWYGDLLERAEVHGQDNAKGKLQERVQTRQPPPEVLYELVKATGPENNRQYEALVRVDGLELGRGRGRRKKDAEQAAARAALRALAIEAGEDPDEA